MERETGCKNGETVHYLREDMGLDIPDDRLRPVRIAGDPVATHIHVCCLRERRDSVLVSSFFRSVERCVAFSEQGPIPEFRSCSGGGLQDG